MAAKELAISPAGLESIAAVQQSPVVEMRVLLRMRMMLATVVAVAFALTLSTAAGAATIVVNSLADPGRTGICALRDAITAANKMTKTNGCAAGTGNDTIQFSVTGTLHLASTLPQVTDRRLTITGPASPGITIDGGKKVQVMQVASSATLNLKNLTIADGFCDRPHGAAPHNCRWCASAAIASRQWADLPQTVRQSRPDSRPAPPGPGRCARINLENRASSTSSLY